MTSSPEPATSPPEPAFDGKAFCRELTPRPGVYRFVDDAGEVLYVGKARNLKKRVSSYFRPAEQLTPKINAMVRRAVNVEVQVTRSEGEALILESNLIKEHRPRYNVVLRDDKSYPYIYLTSKHEFPLLAFHRGARSGSGRYFGPYPSAGAVRVTLNTLQKLFQVRNCEDSTFENRSRPCLQYQIKRCTAPCVGYVTPEEYALDIANAVLFLEGRSDEAVDGLVARMEKASADMEFELAARYRDQIAFLKRIQQRQYATAGKGDIDFLAVVSQEGVACVQVVFVRGGQQLGSKSFFPAHAEGHDEAAILSAFIPQFYFTGSADRSIPAEVVTSHEVADAQLLEQALETSARHRVRLAAKVRGERARALETATENARMILEQKLASRGSQARRMQALTELVEAETPIQRVECFDISHNQGAETVASCVVFGPEGAIKSDYRRFNMKATAAGDDYGAMREVIGRRYARLKSEEAVMPDLILIDGGKGQVSAARESLAELELDDLPMIGVAKGPDRKPGMEELVWTDGMGNRRLPSDSPALHLIQQIRDEAHRFAITGHRQRRARAMIGNSPLAGIKGLGDKRRRALMQHFGGLQGIKRASAEDLARVPGISGQLAQRVFETLHGDG